MTELNSKFPVSNSTMDPLSLLMFLLEPRMVPFYLMSTVVILIFWFIHHHYTYWERRGVPYEKPTWFYGNMKSVGITTTLREPIRDIYQKYKQKTTFVGFYWYFRRAILLTDLDLIKQVLIKDFGNFEQRGAYYNDKDDPISTHLFNLDGYRWHEMRQKLTPTLTSLKMNLMLPVVVRILGRLIKVLRQRVTLDNLKGDGVQTVEMKDLLERFTTDVIANCAYGLDCNSLLFPQTKFRDMGQLVFKDQRYGPLFFEFLQAYPSFGRLFHIKLQRNDVSSFFMQIVQKSLEYRVKHDVKRNDFLNFLMEQRNNRDLSSKQIAAQLFLFFVAGSENSNIMVFALHELSRHLGIQERARNEVFSVLRKHHGKMNPNTVKDLKYIQQVFYETLRLYTIGTFIMRKANEDYKIPGTNHIIEAGTSIIVPIDAIHYDPVIYPEPQIFNPLRFTPEAIEARHEMAWLPFGAGPRKCLGHHFIEMQSVIALTILLKNFRFISPKGMPTPLEIDKKSFVLKTKSGIKLNVEPVTTRL